MIGLLFVPLLVGTVILAMLLIFFAIVGLTNPLIFDSNVNHEHLQEADVDSSFVAARAEPRKTETWPPTRGNDDTAPN